MADKVTTIRVVGKDEASKTFETISQNSGKAASEMEGHASRIGGVFRTLDNQLGQFGIPFTGALSTIGDKLDGFKSKGSGFASDMLGIMGGLGVGVAVAAGGIAVESIHLADGFETAQARLQTAIKNSGGNFDALSPQIQSAYDKMATFGFNATDTAGALATLTNMTHDPQKALGLLGDTANFSAQYNKDLATSAQAVGLAAEGQVGRLARLVPELKGMSGGTQAVTKDQDALQKALENQAAVQAKVNDGTLKGPAAFFALAEAGKKVTDAQDKLSAAQKAGGDILQTLSERDMGAAKTKSETFAGSMKALQAELENVGIKIGLALIPYVKQFASGLQDAVQWVQAHKQDFKNFFDDVSNVVQTAWKVIEPIYKALYDELAGVFQLIDDLVNGRWSKIFGDLVNIVENAGAALIAPVIGVYHLFQSTFDSIGNAISDAWEGTIAPVFGAIEAAVSWGLGGAAQVAEGIWDGVTGAWDSVWGAITGVVTGAIDTVRSAWNDFAGFWNGIHINLPSIDLGPLGSIGGGSIGLPKLPYAADGAVVTMPTLALIGEAGPEAVVPLNRTPGASPLPAAGGGLGGGVTIIVNVSGSVVTERDLIKAIHEGLLRRNRQIGTLKFT